MRAHYEKCYNSEIVELFESDDESRMTKLMKLCSIVQVVKLLLL